MAKPKKTIIHVNQHEIRRNQKTGERKPVLTVKSGKKNTYAHEVTIEGPVRVIYSPDRPLSCGARVWIETYSKVSCEVQNADQDEGRVRDCKDSCGLR
jgi:hypothetical protein